jgi:hypothetical protein
VREVIDRVLRANARLPGVELAAKLGVVDSYVTRLRGGWRPSRVREDLWRRLQSLDPDRSHNVVREVPPAYAVQSRDYFAGKQDTLMAMMRWVVDQQAEIGRHLRANTIPLEQSERLSPPIAEVAAVEAVSERVAKRDASAPRSRKKA